MGFIFPSAPGEAPQYRSGIISLSPVSLSPLPLAHVIFYLANCGQNLPKPPRTCEYLEIVKWEWGRDGDLLELCVYMTVSCVHRRNTSRGRRTRNWTTSSILQS